MDMHWYDIVGLAGTLMILAAFFLQQIGKLSGTALAYQSMNLFGAAGILVSLLGAFNMAVFLLEVAWVLVSAYGIVRTLKQRKSSGASIS